jgi:hypothetical protein
MYDFTSSRVLSLFVYTYDYILKLYKKERHLHNGKSNSFPCFSKKKVKKESCENITGWKKYLFTTLK